MTGWKRNTPGRFAQKKPVDNYDYVCYTTYIRLHRQQLNIKNYIERGKAKNSFATVNNPITVDWCEPQGTSCCGGQS